MCLFDAGDGQIDGGGNGPIDGGGSAPNFDGGFGDVKPIDIGGGCNGLDRGLVALFRLVVVAASGNNMSMHRFMTPNTIREIDRRR